jgi:hypothetical protein
MILQSYSYYIAYRPTATAAVSLLQNFEFV